MVKIFIFFLFTIRIFAFKIEADIINIDNTTNGNKTHIDFRQTFDSTPLVFVLMDKRGPDSSSLRINNISTSGFDIYTVEPESFDGKHTNMNNIPYIAIEKGEHSFPNGDKIIADTISTSKFQSRILSGSSWETISISGFNTTPVVLGQIQTVNNEDSTIPNVSQPWITTVIKSVSSSSFKIALERSETTTGTLNQNEEIAYLIIDSGLSGDSFTDNSNNSIEYETIRSSNSITGWGTEYQINFSKTYSNPVVVSTKNTRDGHDGGWLRRTKINDSYISLCVDEDTATDSERDHTSEVGGILLFSEPFDAEIKTSVSFKKWSEIISDPINNTNNPKRIPGSLLRYCFEATNNSFQSVEDVKMKDKLNSNITYIKSGKKIQNKNTSCDCLSLTDTSGTLSNDIVYIDFGDLGGFFKSSTSRACAYIEFTIK